ncbi:MAG TPA: ChrR family anti-sigma-E factor [Alphaproteobacteria bacterium]|jgi:putative transcriptional regulator
MIDRNRETDERLEHECDMLLMGYACGRLDEAQSLLVASYLSLSERARRHAALYERMGGAVMEHQCNPVAMAEGALQAVMAQLEARIPQPQKPYARRHGVDNIPLPHPLCAQLSQRCAGPPVWRAAWRGVRVLRIPAAPDCHRAIGIVLFRPGARIPMHRHEGREIMLVLDGAFTDESGTHRRGDILIMDADTFHTLRADPREGCACLIVTDTPRQIEPHWVVRLLDMFQ